MKRIRSTCLWGSGVLCLLLVLGLLMNMPVLWQPTAVGAAVAFAVGLGALPAFKGYQYTAWILAAVVAGMLYPSQLLYWGEFDLRNKWLILLVVQLVMFGMGIQMSLRDFTGLATTGRGVLVGLLCQFSIMPIIGFLLTIVFDFEAEIAAGIVLIGACSSGLASNVMVYIARANLVLSVTVTAMATLLAPFMTPFMMKLLAGTLVEVKFINMMMEIVKIVLVPIGAALLHDYLKKATPAGARAVSITAMLCLGWLLALPFGLWGLLENTWPAAGLQAAEMFSFMAGAVVVGVLYHNLAARFHRLNSFMPYLSMFGIVYFTAVTTAAGRDNLLQVGLLLFLAAVIHNTAGYVLGYWFSRLLGLDKNSARSMAFEVGLQNGGMASGLAGTMGKLGTVGLAAAVFSPWMNISGSILANYWRRHPLFSEPKPGQGQREEAAQSLPEATKKIYKLES